MITTKEYTTSIPLKDAIKEVLDGKGFLVSVYYGKARVFLDTYCLDLFDPQHVSWQSSSVNELHNRLLLDETGAEQIHFFRTLTEFAHAIIENEWK